ncbi:MAG: IS21-like element helper ATPase IstB [Acidimicrobiales bacterium]
MLTNPTIEGLYALKCPAMAAGLVEQSESASYAGLPFEERLGMLVDKELTEREDRRLGRYRKQAKLRTDAMVEDIDFRRQRGLDRSMILSLAEGAWVKSHHNVAVVGPTGVGKTFVACALANAAIGKGHQVLYLRAPRMLDELAVARLDGRFRRLTTSWARMEVLVIDDLLIRPLTADQSADLLEVIEDRAGLRSTVVTSQLPISLWHEAMAEPTVADAVLDRICARLHRIELSGESMRRGKEAGGSSEGPRRRGSSATKEAAS